MKYYKVRYNWIYDDLIQPIEVERESDSTIWINGQKHAKRTGYYNYFPSFDEAKEFLINQAKEECCRHQEQFDNSMKLLKKYMELKQSDFKAESAK